ncbi:hypothetical protein ACLOJK_029188 [Asimina triloba]
MQASFSLSSFSCHCSASASSGKSAEAAATLQNGASFLVRNSPPNRAPCIPEKKRDKQSAPAQVSLSTHGRVICSGRLCTRRHFLQSSAAAGPLLQLFPAAAAAATTNSPSDAKCSIATHGQNGILYTQDVLNQIHPPRPDWYEEFYARAMNQVMKSYEEEVAGYKTEIFSHLRRGDQKVLELGVGTGPNFKYYAGAPGISIFGIDPNEHMEKYALMAAEAAGVPAKHFSFAQAMTTLTYCFGSLCNDFIALDASHNEEVVIEREWKEKAGEGESISVVEAIMSYHWCEEQDHLSISWVVIIIIKTTLSRPKLGSNGGIKALLIYALQVGEALPIGNASMDAVVGTLVLCSVKDVNMALKEVKRVLKPGGLYMFVEHVAANDGMPLRFVQNIVDPLQQIIADGCHLTRDTGVEILKAGFSDATVKKVVLSSTYLISSHIYGVARK